MKDLATAKNKEIKQYCTFYVGDYYLGIEISYVQEVLKQQHISYVPLASKKIRGLINLRGEIITAIDMWSMLKIEKKTDSEMNMVVRTTNGTFSFVVEKIGEIIEVSRDKYQAIPSHISDYMKALITGVYQLESGLLLLVNLNKI